MNALSRTTLSQIFNQSGYAAFAVYGAAMALEFAANVAPDLLITDVSMPGMSGIELAIAMKELCPSCKVILFLRSGVDGRSSRVRAGGWACVSDTE